MDCPPFEDIGAYARHLELSPRVDGHTLIIDKQKDMLCWLVVAVEGGISGVHGEFYHTCD